MVLKVVGPDWRGGGRGKYLFARTLVERLAEYGGLERFDGFLAMFVLSDKDHLIFTVYFCQLMILKIEVLVGMDYAAQMIMYTSERSSVVLSEIKYKISYKLFTFSQSFQVTGSKNCRLNQTNVD